MKNKNYLFRILFLVTIAIVFINSSLLAQSPVKISYQAVIRNSSDQLVVNSEIAMQISILQGSASGTAVYVEHQSPTTDPKGLVSIEIGGGTLVSGDFSNIDWLDGPYFIKTEISLTGGIDFTITGTSQILSVPYAFHAKEAESINTSGTLMLKGLGLPFTFTPDAEYVGSEGAFIGFAHNWISEDFIGYKNNSFYFKDSPGGADISDPDVIVGGKVGVGIEVPSEKLEVDGNIDMHNNTIKNLAPPVNGTDAATKDYVDALLKRIEQLEAKLLNEVK